MSYTTGMAVGMAINSNHSDGPHDINVLYAILITFELVFIFTYLIRIALFYFKKQKYCTFFEYVFWEELEASEIITSLFLTINGIALLIYIVSIVYSFLT